MLLFVYSIFGALPVVSADDHFAQEIAPLLQKHCLSCHNAIEQKGGFSLADRQSAFAGDMIIPGDPAGSYLLDLLTPIDGEAEMPKDAEPLTEKDLQSIRHWIEEGAPWPAETQLSEAEVKDFDWWSYRPVERPPVPPSIEWSQAELRSDHPIDAFIDRKLAEKGLSPSPIADRRTLIRRLSFDLIGLPPTPAEVAAFLSDDSPAAYLNAVNRLLDSPRYGERWARHWLDVVKYADTCGYDKDKLRNNAWPYRDYVIRSFNEDKPYTRFVQEQVAGDVLFPGDPDGILGLGFIAAGPWDFIGHVEVPESKIDGQVARNLDRDDMVANTLNTFCSVTVQCARCHNHKFDPITQEHYYGLQAVFAAVDRAERAYDLDPDVEQRRRQLSETIAETKSQMRQLDEAIVEQGGEPLRSLNETVAQSEAALKLSKDDAFGYHSAISATQQAERGVSIRFPTLRPVAQIILHPCHDDFAGIGAGFGFPQRFRVEVLNSDGGWEVVADATDKDYVDRGLRPYQVEFPERPLQGIRVTATKLAPRQNDFILALAELRALDAQGADQAVGAAVEAGDSIEAPPRWGRANLTDGLWAKYNDPQVADRLAKALHQRQLLLSQLRSQEWQKQMQAATDQLAAAEAEIKKLPVGRLVYAAATEFAPQGNFHPTHGKPRDVQVLHRGEVTKPLKSAVPAVLPLSEDTSWQMPPGLGEGERRAFLARWLTRPEHPLVWRSIVNRLWHYHFGAGIVASPNDFGRMGAQPTHPELLDWLAVEFRDGKQSMKDLHRLIVTSRTYRQSSAARAEMAAIDGSNQYLWRMNRRRLEAEEIRDAMLAVSGALDLQMGGPGFYLFALEKTDHSPHFEYHKFDARDPASHRRSIYRFIARSQPDPWMATLDCADSSQSTPKRDETLTALQALALLNNDFNLVMAQRLAARIDLPQSTLSQQVQRAFELVCQRSPDSEELAQLVAYADQHGKENLCRLLFNLSEFVFVD